MIYLVLILGLGLRLISLNQSLWLDEAISTLAVKNNSYWEIVNKFLPGDTHPPLYYWTLKFCTSVFGYSEVSLRLPSVIFGVFTIFMIYFIGKKLISEKVGLIVGLLVATNPLLIYYSQEARMYALSCLLIVTSLNSYLEITKNSKISKWLWFSMVLLLLGMTDYLPLVILPGIWIYHLYRFPIRSGMTWYLKFGLAHLPLAGFYLFWLPTLYEQLINTRAALTVFPEWADLLGSGVKQYVLVWIKFITGRIPFDKSILGIVVFGIVSCVILAALVKAWINRKKISLIWFATGIALILCVVYGLVSPGLSYFRVIFLLPLLILVVAHGIGEMQGGIGGKGGMGKILMIILVISNLAYASFYLFNPNNWREDWRGLVRYVETRVKTNEAVIMAFPVPFAGYQWYAKNEEGAYGVKEFNEPNQNYLNRLTRLVQNRPGVYTLDYLMDATDPERKGFETLKEMGFSEAEVRNFRGLGAVRHWGK